MKVSDLEFYLVEIEATENEQPLRSLLVRLATDAGVEGWGEAPLRWRVSELDVRRDALLPVLAGWSIFDIEELHTLEVLSVAPLRCCLEMALLDLMGKTLQQPLSHLFGGGYRRWIPVAVRLLGNDVDQLAQLAREMADQGFHTQTLAATGRADQDVATVAAIRGTVGDRVELRFDGAAQYEPEAARDLCADLEFSGLQFLLDPLRTRELYPLAALGRQTSVPLAVGKAIRAPSDVLSTVRCGAAPFVVIDPARVGGLIPARKCAAVAEAAGISALLAGEPSVGIATAAMLQLAAATPAYSGCNETAGHQVHDEVLAEPLECVDGMMAVPQGPGLGMEVDRTKLDSCLVT